MAVIIPPDVLPERVIIRLLRMGIDAVGDTELDSILDTLATPERDIAKAEWANRPPTVVMGYPRDGLPFPSYVLTLAGDEPQQDYVGFGEESLFDDDDDDHPVGNQFAQRIKATFALWVYTEHPDTNVWYYRIARRILNVGRRYLITQGLGEPEIRGAELGPDPAHHPENLFIRRLTLSVNYLEQWTDQDALWTAINGTPEAIAATVNAFHEDTPVSDGILGGVSVRTEEEIEEEE